ncbi:MAG: hypothetical protein ACI4L5_02620 [Negativibacillus sp.]
MSEKEVRLIDANIFIRDLTAMKSMYDAIALDGMIKALEEAEIIDQEGLRPHGKWEKSKDDYCGLNIIKCSLCREGWCFEVDDDFFDLNYHYCPNCGAKMDLEE